MGNPESKPDGNVIVRLLSIAVAILITAGLGAVVLSAVIGVLYALFSPSSSKDGQYALSFIFAVPIGGILGGAMGYVLMPPEKPRRKAGRIFSVVGAANVFLSVGIGFLSAGSRGLSLQGFLWTIVSPWCLVPLIASSAMLARGIYLIKAEKGVGSLN